MLEWQTVGRSWRTCGELQALVEESAESLELSLPALSSYQFVHGSFNDRH